MKSKEESHMNALDKKIFFAIKVWLMAVFQGTAMTVAVFVLGKIDAIQFMILGSIFFIVSLVLGRFFDKPINAIALMITKKLNNHPKIKGLILKGI
ncbi:MAG: hypothetical protein AABW59_00715 [archaeon]